MRTNLLGKFLSEIDEHQSQLLDVSGHFRRHGPVKIFVILVHGMGYGLLEKKGQFLHFTFG
jgi:hypothetical protein